MKCVLSYVWVRVRKPDESNYEGWVASRFGWRLYRTFFKTYTEKVWGMPAADMPADWAAQRIKNLSLGTAVLRALFPSLNKGRDVASLIEEFQYPKYGPAMMWERCRDTAEAGGGEVVMNTTGLAVHHGGGRAVAVTARGEEATMTRDDCESVVSSMPLSSLIRAMDPPPPTDVLAAANGLRYRTSSPSPWSFPCLGLEYFVNEGDELWMTSDEELVALATREVRVLGLVTGDKVEAGYVVRMPKAYPVYDVDYAAFVQTIRDWLAERLLRRCETDSESVVASGGGSWSLGVACSARLAWPLLGQSWG